jgi:NAD(P) transhydrogenase
VGCGPAGERAAILAARAGRRVAVIERSEVVGGAAINWGTIPSKTLRESALFVYSQMHKKLEGIRTEISEEITIQDFMYRKEQVVQRELELINRSLARHRVDVFRGSGVFLDEHHLSIHGAAGQSRGVLRGEIIVIATGSTPNHPPDVPFDGRSVFDSSTILELPKMPRSMLVLGAGVIGVEYAAIFTALGLEVTLVDTRSQLLPYLDREIVDRLEREMCRMGMLIIHDDTYERIEASDGKNAHVRCLTRNGDLLEADVMLYAIGRDGAPDSLNLEAIGIQPTPRGLIEVNENFQTAHPHIYAVGDVIGYPALASTSMEQGRRAMRHALGIKGINTRLEILPFAIYSVPEVSYVGRTEEELKSEGRDYIVGRGLYAYNPRAQIMSETGGLLKLLFDGESMRLEGAHIVGVNASELIHTGLAFLRSGATAMDIADNLYNYPTLSDLYRHAAMEAVGRKLKRGDLIEGW